MGHVFHPFCVHPLLLTKVPESEGRRIVPAVRHRGAANDPTPILPASCLVAPVVWELDVDIEQALRAEPAPVQCPAGRLYVPSAVRDWLGPHVTLLWSSWARSDSALFEQEVLVAYLG